MQVKAIKMRWNTGGHNYCYLLSSDDKAHSWLIDPAEPDEVIAGLDVPELQSIKAIANTHHHYDHAGGNTAVLAQLKSGGNGCVAKIICGSAKSAGATDVPQHLQKFKLGDLHITAVRTPCHTQDSVCYYVQDAKNGQKAIFTGDTLFTAGCGRFFEGTAKEMDVALNKTILDAVGEDNYASTKVYPGHEYTRSNIAFVRKKVFKNKGDNKALDDLEEFCKRHEVTTGYFTIADELNFNPFMRIDDPEVRNAVGDSDHNMPREQVMDKLRTLKNAM